MDTLTDGQRELMWAVVSNSQLEDLVTDWDKVVELGGYKNTKSAKNQWWKIKVALKAAAGGGAADKDSPSKTSTPTKKRKADASADTPTTSKKGKTDSGIGTPSSTKKGKTHSGTGSGAGTPSPVKKARPVLAAPTAIGVGADDDDTEEDETVHAIKFEGAV